jgi:protein TonB
MHAMERNASSSSAWRPSGSSRRACLAAIVVVHAAAVFAWWQLPAATVQRVMPTRVAAMILPAPVTGKAPQAPPRAPPKALPLAKPRVVSARQDTVTAPVLAPMPQEPAMAAPRAMAIETAAIVAATPPAAPAPTPVPAHEPPAIVAPRFDAAYLENAPPAYPTLARRYREQGVVVLDVRVTASGRAGEVGIRKSSGSPRLDDAARAAVGSWRFIPARQGDTPVTAWVVVPVRFSLDG